MYLPGPLSNEQVAAGPPRPCRANRHPHSALAPPRHVLLAVHLGPRQRCHRYISGTTSPCLPERSPLSPGRAAISPVRGKVSAAKMFGHGKAKVTDRHTNGIDREEEKVDFAAKLGNANGPYLSHNYTPDGTTRCGEVKPAGTVRCWEDLQFTNVSLGHTLDVL